MGNYLAIAATTAVFSQKIRAAINNVSGLSAAPQIFLRRPDKRDEQMVGANVYLYDIQFNHTLRNNDLTTRAADGSLIQQPQVPLNLRYHISFYGEESTLEAQRMMGATVIKLHAEPLILPEELQQYIDAVGSDGHFTDSVLHQQNTRITIEPIMLSLDEITKMWSSLFTQPHEPSLIYEISVILLQAELPVVTPKKARNIAHNFGDVDRNSDEAS